MKTIYLHIGQTKTATTTLQAFFFTNRQWLLEHDVYYPECPYDHKLKAQHRYLVESLRNSSLPIPENIQEWDFLVGQIEKTEKNNILISEEVFWHLYERRPSDKPLAIRWIRDKLSNYNIKVICYLRRQDQWLESWYNQLTKTDVSVHSKLSFLEFIAVYKNYKLLDYNLALAPWADIMGKDNLIVKPFERSRFLNQDIIADFLSILGIMPDKNTKRPSDKQVSLCNSACELSSIFNRTAHAKEFKNKFRDIIGQYDKESNDKRKFTNKALCESIVNEYLESNKLLSKRFSEGGVDFFDSNIKGYEFGEYGGLSVVELASFLMQVFLDQQGQIRVLRKRILEIEQKMRTD